MNKTCRYIIYSLMALTVGGILGQLLSSTYLRQRRAETKDSSEAQLEEVRHSIKEERAKSDRAIFEQGVWAGGRLVLEEVFPNGNGNITPAMRHRLTNLANIAWQDRTNRFPE